MGPNMNTSLLAHLVIASGFAAACSSAPPRDERPVATPRAVTMVGCVEPSLEHGQYVLRGLAIDSAIGAPTGSRPNELQSTETLPGGDAIRNPSDLTPEEWASRITPQLEGDSARVRELVGHRVVVTGTYVAAGGGAPLDLLKVKTLALVSAHCIDG